MRTTCDTTAIALTYRTGITRQSLQRNYSSPTFIIRRVNIRYNSLKLLTLFIVLIYEKFALCFAILHRSFCHNSAPLLTEREVEGSEKFACFVIGLGSGGNGYIETTNRVNLVEINFREDDLFTNAHGVIATTIE